MGLIGGIIIYLLESRLYPIPEYILLSYKGNYKSQYDQSLNLLIPKVTFIARLGIGMSFLCCYKASFGDSTLFPNEKRTSAIGIC